MANFQGQVGTQGGMGLVWGIGWVKMKALLSLLLFFFLIYLFKVVISPILKLVKINLLGWLMVKLTEIKYLDFQVRILKDLVMWMQQNEGLDKVCLKSKDLVSWLQFFPEKDSFLIFF